MLPERKTEEGPICVRLECFQKAVKSRGLERSFKQAIPKEVYDALEKEMEALETE